MRQIEDKEYRRIEREVLAAFAIRIRGGGVGYSEIARGTGLSFKTVSRAARGKAIRCDAMIRIDYYLRERIRERNKNL